jgi:hypothetical protein
MTKSPRMKPKSAARPRTAIKRALARWESPRLVNLVLDLFDLSPENQAFLRARVQAIRHAKSALAGFNPTAPYEKLLYEVFWKSSGWPQDNPNLAVARKLLRTYQKASEDLQGAVHLMVTYVELGTEFCTDLGVDGDREINSMMVVLAEVDKVLRGDYGIAIYEFVRERLLRVRDLSSGFGWGYGDGVSDYVDEWEERWSAATTGGAED